MSQTMGHGKYSEPTDSGGTGTAGCYRSALLYRLGTRLMGIILPYILYGKRTKEFFWRYGLRAYMS